MGKLTGSKRKAAKAPAPKRKKSDDADGWPWDPARPVAGQYEEHLAALLAVQKSEWLAERGLPPDHLDIEALANDLLLGADAARQAQQDGYHGPAVVVALIVGEEPEQGVEFEVEPVFCAALHDGDCAPAAWGDGPMVCVVPLRAHAEAHTPNCDTMTNDAFPCNCEPEQRKYLTQINEHKPGTPYPGAVIRRSSGRGSTAPSPDYIPIRAGAPEAIGLTPRQLREQTAAAVAAEDALRDPEVTARNARRLVERAEHRELTATEILDVADAVERGEVKLPGEEC